MNRIKFYFSALAVVLMLAACNGDKKVELSEMVTGKYNGTMTFMVMDKEQGSMSTYVTIDRQDEQNVTVVLKGNPDATEAMAIKADLVVKGVKVVADGNTMTLAETEINTTAGNTKYKGKLSGTIANGEAQLTYIITPGAMPMPITAKFQGKK